MPNSIEKLRDHLRQCHVLAVVSVEGADVQHEDIGGHVAALLAERDRLAGLVAALGSMAMSDGELSGNTLYLPEGSLDAVSALISAGKELCAGQPCNVVPLRQ